MKTIVASTVVMLAAQVVLASTSSGDSVPLHAVPLSPCSSSDNGDPDLMGLTVLTPRVNTREGDAHVVIRVTGQDTGGPGAASGIDRISVAASKRNSAQTPQATLTLSADGSWRGVLTIKQGTRSGDDWNIHYLDMYDRVGNYRQYLSEDLDALGAVHGFTVSGPVDKTDPVVSGLRVRPSVADVRQRSRELRVRTIVSDDVAVREVALLAYNPRTGRQQIGKYLHRTSGSSRRGVWTGAVGVPRWVTPGPWKLEVRVRDAVGRTTRRLSRWLASQGLPSSIQVISRPDTERPQIGSTLADRAVDARSQDVNLPVTVQATDERSGITRMTVELWPPSTGGNVIAATAHRSGGTPRKGTWTATVPVAMCDAWSGTWLMRVYAWDRVGHRTITNQGQVTMLASDHAVEAITSITDPAPQIGPATVTFGEDVTGITTTTAVVRPTGYTRWQAAEPPAPIPGTWSCLGAAGQAVSCEAGLVRSASFVPPTPFQSSGLYEIWPNPEHIIAVTDAAGNPAYGTWSFAATP